MATTVIGATTTYHGSAHPYLEGWKVRIVSVRKHLAPPEEPFFITSNEELEALGGVAFKDTIDIAPVMANGQVRFPAYPVPPKSLACFAFLCDGACPPGCHEG